MNNQYRTSSSEQNHMHPKNKNHYGKLIWMALISFLCMYVLMYSMADRMENVYPNINQFYMAGLMTMPMIIIELLLMRMMYQNSRLNGIIVAFSMLLLTGFYVGIRQQVAVSDRQFLRGMIPHHAAAILMSKQAPSQDPEIQQLQAEIIKSQEQEIAQMKAILKRLKDEK